MTLTAPRSRQGRFILVLAILTALAAVSAALLWSTTASAQLPATTVELDQAPDGPGTVVPGGAVTYQANADLTLGLSGTDELTIELDFDANLGNPVVTCTPAADDSGVTATQAFCNWDDPVGAGSYQTQVDGIAAGDLVAPSGRVCADTNGDSTCDQETGTDEIAMDDDNPTDTGALTVDASGLATADPASATNPPGTSHTVTFTLQPFVDCVSGNTANGAAQTDVSCDASDVPAMGCAATVDSVVVTNSAIDGVTTVEVTISNGGAEESCTVGLSLVANTGDDDDTNDVPFTVSATKDYSLAAVAGELRHLDEPDSATEDAFGDCSPGGILCEMDDPDDAIGSFHVACIVNVLDPATPGLTNADAPDITWDIEPLIGATPVASSVTEIAGPNGEACVRWGSGHTGAQQITATWDNGVAPAVTFFWNAYCIEGDQCYDADDDTGATTVINALELVKEWNTIDFTKIVAADGDVGDTLDDNTGQLDLNPSTQRDATLHQNANVDGTTVDVNGVLIIGPAGFGHVDADGQSFVEYVFGAHNDAGGFYSGPVDGVEQTFTVSGDCGSVRLEDPVNGTVIILYPGQSQTLLSSDKGIGFEILPNDEGAIETTPANADCDPSSSVTVSIHSEEHELFRSPPAVVLDPDEEITVHWFVGPPTNKQPLLLWAGMRQLLEHDWSDADGLCPWGDPFFVRYTIQTGNGALVSDLGDGIAFGPDFMIVQVGGGSTQSAGETSNPEGANTNCISRVVYESQDEGEQDIVAHVVEPLCPQFNLGSNGGFQFPGCDWSVISQQVPFLLYYMKFESVTLGLVPGSRTGHNSGDFDPATEPVFDPANDVTDMTANVSADVLARVKVRGWLVRNNCPVRDAGQDSNGSFLPANRCIFPDDWEHIAGGVLAEEFRPNYDIMIAPDSSYNCTGSFYLTCNSSEAPGVVGSTTTGYNPVRGPFSLLDGPYPGDSLAPDATGGFRETWLHDGDVDDWDAPMPPALIRFLLSGSGFLRAADKKDVYNNGENPFYETHIPAEPWITPINEDLSGYQWNTWGIGSKSGPYVFWTSLADHSAEVISCPGASPCAATGVATGGYKMTRVYTDNHGEAMTWVNGDADLTWADCDVNTTVPAYNIVQLSGYYCEQGDEVGNSTLNAVADYPDKRKHQPIASENVTITWTWGGIKNVTIEPGATDQFHYVVLHVSDRDGFCDLTTSLHPVLGELVTFVIDSPEGIIFPDSNGIEAQGPVVVVAADKKSATTHTYAATATECEAWIHVSESQEQPVNVVIQAFDPEGTVTFDVLVNEPPEPTPTPSPTPAPPPDLWGDLDCDGDVDSVDALGGLRYVAGFFVNQTGPCSDVGSDITVDGNAEVFGDWDCDGDVDAVDALQILLWVAGLDGDQTPPCPNIGAGVTIT